jgi:hypothetical protein
MNDQKMSLREMIMKAVESKKDIDVAVSELSDEFGNRLMESVKNQIFIINSAKDVYVSNMNDIIDNTYIINFPIKSYLDIVYENSLMGIQTISSYLVNNYSIMVFNKLCEERKAVNRGLSINTNTNSFIIYVHDNDTEHNTTH